MKQLLFILLLAGLGISFSNKTPQPKSSPLEGTWKLVAAKGYEPESTHAGIVIYKIFTGKQVHFVYYNEKTGEFRGAGGGTYTLEGDTFQEKLEYFSWDSTAVGTVQAYHFKINGNRLTQSGTLNSKQYQNYEVEEVYERVEDGISSTKSKHPLIGVWAIESAQYGDNKPNIQETYGKVIKIITPGFFYGVFFNPDTKHFNGITFGNWRAEGNQYIETVQVFSWDETMAKQEQPFTWEVKADKFYQRGKINAEKYKDYTIEEVSKRLE